MIPISTQDEFLSELRSQWEACGPWVPDDSLTDEGRSIKNVFVGLLNDSRIAPPPMATTADGYTIWEIKGIAALPGTQLDVCSTEGLAGWELAAMCGPVPVQASKLTGPVLGYLLTFKRPMTEAAREAAWKASLTVAPVATQAETAEVLPPPAEEQASIPEGSKIILG